MQELTNIEKIERNKRVAKKIGRGMFHVLKFITAGAGESTSISYGKGIDFSKPKGDVHGFGVGGRPTVNGEYPNNPFRDPNIFS